MSDCLRIRLRPTGPWRIAPDSGERDRAGQVFHSDTLYSAVCSAMLRLGVLEEWLAITALEPSTARVRFTSLFPYLGDTYYLPAPRGLWPPPPSSKLYGRAARFLPQSVAARLFDGKPVQEDRWDVDGASQCLLPTSARGTSSGPFRMALRSGAAVDRLAHGNCEVHRTACLEFAPNAGLWFIVQFADVATRKEWGPRVTGALCLLADSGFGGRRSIGWGQCDFVEAELGTLSDLVLGKRSGPERRPERKPTPPPAPPMEQAAVAGASQVEALRIEPQAVEPQIEVEPQQEEPLPAASSDSGSVEALAPEIADESATGAIQSSAEPETAPEAPDRETTPEAVPVPATEPTGEPVAEPVAAAAAEPALKEAEPEPEPAPIPEAVEEIVPEAEAVPTAWWLLSLFTPGPGDAIDWQRGAYTLLERSGRVDSPQGSGEIKKSLRMVEEGSVLFTDAAPLGAAIDVAPDGFPHPVYRSGYAVALRVPFRGTV